MVNWFIGIYGLLILTLGYIGFYKGGSMMSLYTGVIFGLLLMIDAVLMAFKIRFAPYAALFLTLALTLTFAIRYSITHKGIPAILAVLSGGMLLFLLVRLVQWRR